MKKRLLIALLTLGMIMQTVSVPVWAAEESADLAAGPVSGEADEAEERVDPIGSTDVEEPSESGDLSDPEEPSESGNLSDPEGPSESGDPSESGSPSDTEEPSESDNPSDTEEPPESDNPSDTEEPPESGSPSDTEEPSESGNSSDTEEPSDAEEEAGSEDPSDPSVPEESEDQDPEDPESLPEDGQPATRKLLAANKQVETVSVSSGEGIYQEGSFTVLGAGEPGSAAAGYRDPQMVEDKRAEAEEYLYQQMLAKNENINMEQYRITTGEAPSFISGVINEHPELYYVSGYKYSFYKASQIIFEVKPNYLSGYDDTLFWTGVEDALSVVDDSMSELEKAIALHEYIVVNCEYDYANYLAGTLPREVYSAYGVLANHKAVCQGYALAYKLLLNRVGIECCMVTSDEMNHAWNLIKLDGQYYQVDTTWDDPVWDRLGLVSHNYMFLSDETFRTEVKGVRNAHYDWEITRGSLIVDLKADSTRFDNEFWVGCRSPFILDNGMCYYIESSGDYQGYGKIKERNLSAGTESVLLDVIGRWDAGGGQYWTAAYSGLFMMGDRLYFNTPTNICSIPISGGSVRTETDLLSSGDKYVYGVAFRQGQIHYLQKTSPNDTSGNILLAELKQQVEVPVVKIVLDREETVMGIGETLQLTALVSPSYATQAAVSWASDDETVATVEAGMVTAIAKGTCTVTASAGGKQAACQVQVIDKPRRPVFSPKEPVDQAGRVTVDKGSQVTIGADPGTTVYYTINGAVPDPSDDKATLRYTAPVTVNEDTTIKAVAVFDKDTALVSDVAEQTFIACTNQIKLGTDEVVLKEGEEQTVAIQELPTTRSAADVEWRSADPKTAAVTADGKIKALLEGKTTVTAAVEDHKGETVTATCEVTVEAPVYEVTFTGFRDQVIKTEQVKARRNATPPRYDSQKPEASDFSFPEGYRFTGWEGSYENIQCDTVVRAKYELIRYEIRYELNGGVNGAGNPATYTVESKDIRLAPAGGKEGYLFTGWYEDAECREDPVSVIRQGSHGDITLYAGWKDERGLWMKAEGSDKMNDIPPQPYTGKAIKPAVEVWYGDKPLEQGKDYTISYRNNTNVKQPDTQDQQQKEPTITVKGKGNFAGNITRTFVITPVDLGDQDIQIDPLAAVYSGKRLTPVPSVVRNGKKLKYRKDFTVEYPDSKRGGDAYQKPGTYAVVVKGCGNYTGQREIPFTVTDPEAGEILLDRVKVSRIPDQAYTGKAVKLTQDMPLLTLGAETLLYGKDYTLEYGPCIESGTHQVLIVGQGSYKGVRRVSFKIRGTAIGTAKIGKLQELTYSGEELTYDTRAHAGAEDKLTIMDPTGKTELREGKDYELSYRNHINVGTAKVTITGKGAYSGSVTKSFRIVPYSLEKGSPKITAEIVGGKEQTWQKGGVVPKLKVTFKGVELVEGTDYVLSGRNHTENDLKKGKEPLVVLKGRKNFCGSRELAFTVIPQDLSAVTVTAQDLEENGRSGKYQSKPVLTDRNGKVLKAGTDYEKTYVYQNEAGKILGKTDRPEAGSCLTVVVTGKGNYRGSAQASYRIIPKGTHISKAKVKVTGKFYYTGERILPSKDDLTVTMGKTTLTADDYEIVACTNNINRGTGKLTIRGKGKYGGTKQVSFRILSQNMKWWEKGMKKAGKDS